MQTKIQKIAVGGGRFEMRKVMAAVKTELGRESVERAAREEGEEGREGSKAAREEGEGAGSRMSSAGVFASEGVQGKLQISVRNEPKPLQISVRNDLGAEGGVKRSSGGAEEEVRKPRKRLAMYRTLADGTVEKEYIGYDDPILARVPIRRGREEEAPRVQATKVNIAKDKTGSNFQVVRPSKSLEKATSSLTLAEKAREVRSRGEGGGSRGEGFQTLASRAQKRRSDTSPEERAGAGSERRERKERSPGGERPVFARLGPKY